MIRTANAAAAAATENTTMVEDTEEANDAVRTADRLRFQVADCSTPVQREEGPFHVVSGAWLYRRGRGA